MCDNNLCPYLQHAVIIFKLLISTYIFCVHYLYLIARVYVFYVGHIDKNSLYETLFHCNILSKHHHYHHRYRSQIITLAHDIARRLGIVLMKLLKAHSKGIYIDINICIYIYIHIYIYICLYI
jgi:hypothetical protein